MIRTKNISFAIASVLNGYYEHNYPINAHNINKDNQILNINGFKKLNGGRSLTKSQMRLLRLRKIKLTSEQAKNEFVQDV